MPDVPDSLRLPLEQPLWAAFYIYARRLAILAVGALVSLLLGEVVLFHSALPRLPFLVALWSAVFFATAYYILARRSAQHTRRLRSYQIREMSALISELRRLEPELSTLAGKESCQRLLQHLEQATRLEKARQEFDLLLSTLPLRIGKDEELSDQGLAWKKFGQTIDDHS